jgi:hypothetical protein
MGHHAREPARRGVAVIIDLNGHLKSTAKHDSRVLWKLPF